MAPPMGSQQFLLIEPMSRIQGTAATLNSVTVVSVLFTWHSLTGPLPFFSGVWPTASELWCLLLSSLGVDLIQLGTLPLVIFRTSIFTASGQIFPLFFNMLGQCLLFLKASSPYPLPGNTFWCLNPSQVSTFLEHDSSLSSSNPVNRGAGIHR